MLRLTWVQPEDLTGHELRQAARTAVSPRRSRPAGGRRAARRHRCARARPSGRPPATCACWPPPAGRTGRSAQCTGGRQPTALAGIRALCPDWPASPALPPAPPGPERLEAAWLGRAVGCLLGKPVEKLPLGGIRLLARAAGNWPLTTYFTARGVPEELLARYPWNRRSAATSLAENIDGMPEDDDLNYPLLGLLVLRRHGRAFTTADVARVWLDELPAGRTFTAERVAYRNLLCGWSPR
ncbi:ADP-ribosylglycohydrolase OS=Streptomyces griseomycini OX=66895 GN=FHS37_000267 PE=4 SV=1 [Streptomyces griseomycini]